MKLFGCFWFDTFFFFAIAKLFHIQFAEGDKYREIALKETLRKTFSSLVGGIFFLMTEVFWQHQWHVTK